MRLCALAFAFIVIGCAGKRPSDAKSATSSAVQRRGAEVGKPAPDFTLTDLDGKSWNLRQLKGSPVVLEWFNPKCPLVIESHTTGSLVGSAKRHVEKGVVWLAINSTASGKEGFGREENLEGKRRFGMDYPILFDQMGVAGHAYGATYMPYLFVLDKEGTVVYRGAIDNSADGDTGPPAGGRLVNHVDEVLAS